MRLNPGVTLERADEVLHNAETAWINARGGTSGYYRAYTDAVQNTYAQLKQVFAAPDLAGGIRSSTFWNLLALGNPRQTSGYTTDPDIAQAWQDGLRAMNHTFSAEIDNQLQALERARADLVKLKELSSPRFGGASQT